VGADDLAHSCHAAEREFLRQARDQPTNLGGDLRSAAGARKRQCQKSRKPARRQLMTISGFTMTRTSAQRGQQRRKTAQKNLSSRFEMGRARLRFSTVTCVSEGEYFKSRITPTAKENSECGKECED
jgi:hypothetical protein